MKWLNLIQLAFSYLFSERELSFDLYRYVSDNERPIDSLIREVIYDPKDGEVFFSLLVPAYPMFKIPCGNEIEHEINHCYECEYTPYDHGDRYTPPSGIMDYEDGRDEYKKEYAENHVRHFIMKNLKIAEELQP